MEQEALAVERAHVGKDLHHLPVLDPLRDHLLVQIASDIAQRFDEDAVALVGSQVADEAAIDLQIVDVEALQVVERAEARAEIVEREAAAQLLQLADELLRHVHVGHGRGFRDLEHQLVVCVTPLAASML